MQNAAAGVRVARWRSCRVVAVTEHCGRGIIIATQSLCPLTASSCLAVVLLSGFGPTVGKTNRCVVATASYGTLHQSSGQLQQQRNFVRKPGDDLSSNPNMADTEALSAFGNSPQHGVRYMCWLQLRPLGILISWPLPYPGRMCPGQCRVRRSAAWRSPAGSAAPAHAAAPA
jgi:hypothetical protein